MRSDHHAQSLHHEHGLALERIPPGSIRVPCAIILALAAVIADDSLLGKISRNRHHPLHEFACQDRAAIAAVLKTLVLATGQG